MSVLFNPDTRTEFEWESWTTWHGRRTHKIFYRVRQSNSSWKIVYEKSQQIVAGYKGYVYVDKDLNMIMRITREGEDIPVDFPIQNVKQVTEYSFQKIGEHEQEFLVPVYSGDYIEVRALHDEERDPVPQLPQVRHGVHHQVRCTG